MRFFIVLSLLLVAISCMLTWNGLSINAMETKGKSTVQKFLDSTKILLKKKGKKTEESSSSSTPQLTVPSDLNLPKLSSSAPATVFPKTAKGAVTEYQLWPPGSAEKEPAPNLVALLNLVTDYGLNEEGVFRKSPGPQMLGKVVALLQEQQPGGRIVLTEQTDPERWSYVNQACVLIKQFFQEYYKDNARLFGDVNAVPTAEDVASEKIKLILNNVKAGSDRDTVDQLFTLLAKVIENKSVTLMDASNLGAVFGPGTFNEPPKGSPKEVADYYKKAPSAFEKILTAWIDFKGTDPDGYDKWLKKKEGPTPT